jgi:hypothetical protein
VNSRKSVRGIPRSPDPSALQIHPTCDVLCTMAHIHAHHAGVCYLRYVANWVTPREGAGQPPALLLQHVS